MKRNAKNQLDKKKDLGIFFAYIVKRIILMSNIFALVLKTFFPIKYSCKTCLEMIFWNKNSI